MDACHLLIGHPWKYDVKTQHDGKNNTYVITMDGNKFTPHPNSNYTNGKEDEPKVMIVGEKEMLQTLKN